MSRFVDICRQYGLYFAWLVALVATGGSLYLSEVLHYQPCVLCWYQRIFMYPQVILLGMATFRNDRGIIRYIIPLSVIGGIFSVVHYLEQKIPGFSAGITCQVYNPCNIDYLNWFGFITIPLLALIAFILIILFCLGAKERN